MRFIAGVLVGAAAVGWFWRRAARRERRGRELDAQEWSRERERARQRIGAADPLPAVFAQAVKRTAATPPSPFGPATPKEVAHARAIAEAQRRLADVHREAPGRHRRDNS